MDHSTEACRFLGAHPVRRDYNSLKLCVSYPSQATGQLAMKHTVAVGLPRFLSPGPHVATGMCPSPLGPLPVSFFLITLPQVCGSSALTAPAVGVSKEPGTAFTACFPPGSTSSGWVAVRFKGN